MSEVRHKTSGIGIGVDSSGGPVIDPTQNVISLSEASAKRQDDLREAHDLLIKVELKRLDDLRAAESRRIDEQATLRASYEDRLAVAEASRINAIRVVDVSAVSVASERATQQAQVLATQVTASADALRALVATTAATMATQTQNLSNQFTDRLAMLERAQYENKGRQGVADPQAERLSLAVEQLLSSQAVGAGKSQGIDASWGKVLAIALALIAAAGLVAQMLKH